MKLLLIYCDCLEEIINVSSCKDCEYFRGIKDELLWCDYEDEPGGTYETPKNQV